MVLNPGCRYSYELLGDGPAGAVAGDGDGDTSLAGSGPGDGDTSGDGDGDGDQGDGDGDQGDGDTIGGTGGGPGTGGDAGSDGGTLGTGGDPGMGGDPGTGGDAGTGGSTGDYHVTTDAGDASPGSFREAIDLAILDGTPKTITFDPDLFIVMDERVPQTSSSIEIIGNNTHFDFSTVSGNPDCFAAVGGALVLDGLEISGCPSYAVFFNGSTGSQIKNSYLHDNGGGVETGPTSSGSIIGPSNRIEGTSTHAVLLNTPGDTLIDNEIFDSAGNGVFISGSAHQARLIGNLIVRTNIGVQLGSGVTGVLMVYNTLVSIQGNGLTVGQGLDVDVRNNVFSYCSIYGINGAQARFTELSHNLYFQNTSGNCNQCTPGTGAKVNEDPLFSDFASDDFIPLVGSPVIDGAEDITGVDRNGAAANNGYGGAPDIGYYETNY